MVVVVVAAGGAGAPLKGGSGSSGPLLLSLLLRTVVEVSRRAPYWELREKTSIPPSKGRHRLKLVVIVRGVGASSHSAIRCRR
jgi:hypothetical protein